MKLVMESIVCAPIRCIPFVVLTAPTHLDQSITPVRGPQQKQRKRATSSSSSSSSCHLPWTRRRRRKRKERSGLRTLGSSNAAFPNVDIIEVFNFKADRVRTQSWNRKDVSICLLKCVVISKTSGTHSVGSMRILGFLWIIGFAIWPSIVCESILNSKSIDAFQNEVTRAVQLAKNLRWKEAEDVVKRILATEPNHFDANQIYGKIKQLLISEILFSSFCRSMLQRLS